MVVDPNPEKSKNLVTAKSLGLELDVLHDDTTLEVQDEELPLQDVDPSNQHRSNGATMEDDDEEGASQGERVQCATQ